MRHHTSTLAWRSKSSFECSQHTQMIVRANGIIIALVIALCMRLMRVGCAALALDRAAQLLQRGLDLQRL